jgi:hypothetical protein
LIPNAKPAYDRADTQQLIETVKRLEKMLNALSAYVPQTDIDTGVNKKLVIDAGVVTVVDP